MCAKCVVHSRPASSPALAANTLPLQTQSNSVLWVTPEPTNRSAARASGESSGIDSPATPVRTTMAPSGNRGWQWLEIPELQPDRRIELRARRHETQPIAVGHLRVGIPKRVRGAREVEQYHPRQQRKDDFSHRRFTPVRPPPLRCAQTVRREQARSAHGSQPPRNRARSGTALGT